jgi:methionyl-tRNA formyltransferase
VTDLAIAFLGTPDAAVPTLERVVDAGFAVPLVITRPDRRRGRGGKTSPSPVKAAAERLGLEVYQPESVNDPECLARIVDAPTDVLLIVAFGQILKKPLLAAPRVMPLNLHFSLLPAYRGAAPVAKAIADGCPETGVSLQRVVRKLDAGPVLATVRASIGAEETTADLETRLAGIGAELTVATLRRLAEGEVEERPQDEERATYAPMLSKEDGRVDWSRAAPELACHVRAMNPWPGARTRFTGAARGKTVGVTLLRARPEEGEPSDRSPGEIVELTREAILIEAGEGRLAVTELKPEGKRVLAAREFANGYHVAPGDRFGADV